MTGIVSYGTYIPKYRIKISDIAKALKRDSAEVTAGLQIEEKAIASSDEDAATLAVEAGLRALTNGEIDPLKIGAITVGSESHPYAVKPTSTIVGEMLGVGNHYFAADLQFACKAATAGMQFLWGLVASRKIDYGLAIGSDVAQAKQGDILEYTAASAAAAYILGKKRVIAEIVDFVSFTSNTPDFWRRDGQAFPSHGGRFTGEPAYFNHVINASKTLLAKVKKKQSDFTYAVFHMPNGKFPKEVAKRLGFDYEQIQAGFVVDKIGNPYSGSSLAGLAAVLDIAHPNDTIFFCSYGSGAGADAFIIKTTKDIITFQKQNTKTILSQIEQKVYVDYNFLTKCAMNKQCL
ncbi:hydroxymethylglutaryl-CoA synthase [Candidatus Shapirobacteria bacterium]|nr:hydroxymethylglutaryl-CoA synthase [Candidatus Shapirobacteria bacterium]